MRVFRILFLFNAGLIAPAYPEPTCAYDLIQMQHVSVEIPQGFSLWVATPRLLIGHFARTPDGNLDILERQTWKTLGTLSVCQSGRSACYPIYLDQNSFGDPLGEQNLGRGLGTEAKYAILAHAFEKSETDVVYARVAEGNERSLRLHRRLGFVAVRFSQVPLFAIIRSLPFRPVIYLRLTRADFEAWHTRRDKNPEAINDFFRLTRF